MTYEELLIDTALKDERVVVMTAENRALVRGAGRRLGDRFIDTGITEQTLVGMAAGLALRGRIPVIHALAPFLTMRAYEFIRTDVGIAHLPVKLSGYIPGFLSDGNGPTHQSIEDVAIMRGIPGMEVYCPADEDDLVKMLPAIWASPSPAYVRINHKVGSYTHTPYVPGEAEVLAHGTDVTILVYGFLFDNALQAKGILEKEGLSVGLVNMRSLKPVDEEAIIAAARQSSLLVTIEDHLRTGGLYSIATEVLMRRRELNAELLPLALEDRWFRPGRLSEVLETEGFTAAKIAKRIGQSFSAIGQKSSSIGQASSSIGQESSSNGQASTSIGQASSSNGQASSSNGQASSSFTHSSLSHAK